MIKKFVLVLMLLGSLFHSCTQSTSNKPTTLPYDVKKLSSGQTLNLLNNELRGIQDQDGSVYFVDDDLKGLTAYQNGKLKWKADIIGTCGKPMVGSPEIRYIQLDKADLFVVFGKHDFAKVQGSDGTISYLGSD